MMDTLIVTAGNDRQYRFWTKRLVGRLNAWADDVPGALRAYDITPHIEWDKIGYPPMSKLYVWRCVPEEINRVVWIDTDCYVARPIMHDELPWTPFSAVIDPWIIGGDKARTNKAMTGERGVLLQLERYFNSGFYVATREAIPAFDRAIEEAPKMFLKRENWVREQDLFNYAVWQTLGHGTEAGWNQLGEEWNCMPKMRIDPTVEPIVSHLAAIALTKKGRILDRLFAGKDMACALSS
jgi:hypothetical protein